MFGNRTKLAAVLGAAFAAALTLGLPDRAAAAPPPGMRWSDHAWGSPSRPPTDLKGYGLQQWMNSHRGAALRRGSGRSTATPGRTATPRRSPTSRPRPRSPSAARAGRGSGLRRGPKSLGPRPTRECPAVRNQTRTTVSRPSPRGELRLIFPLGCVVPARVCRMRTTA